MSKMSPFDIVKSLSETKDSLVNTPEDEKDYIPFIINRAFSYYPDTNPLAQIMNKSSHIPVRLQHDFYMTAVKSRKRYSPWAKKSDSKDVEVIKQVYSCSNKKALEYMRILTKEQIEDLHSFVDPGGVKARSSKKP